MTVHLVWFRRDLHLYDNLALAATRRDRSAHALAFCISTPEQWKAHDMVPHQAILVNAQLNTLQTTLAEKDIPLLFHEVADFTTSVEVVKGVCVRHGVSRVLYNHQYEVNECQRDVAVEKLLPQMVCEGLNNSVILSPGAVMTGNHEMYKVFISSRNVWLKRIKDRIPERVSAPKVRENGAFDSPLTSIPLSYPQQDFSTQQSPVEEKLIIVQSRHFCQRATGEYEQPRGFPMTDETSRSSANLATGGLSPRQCLDRLLVEQPQALEDGAGNVWLNESIWREFYRHLVTYHLLLCRYQPFIR